MQADSTASWLGANTGSKANYLRPPVIWPLDDADVGGSLNIDDGFSISGLDKSNEAKTPPITALQLTGACYLG
jgi:hypothetical protein